MIKAHFQEGGKRWPPDDAESLIKYWGPVLTQEEIAAVRGSGDKSIADGLRYHRRLITLRVDEAFAGSPGQTLSLMSGTGECCDCSPRFGMGEQYLVVASRWQGRWTTSTCAGTTSAAGAALDIDALRAWKAGRRLAPAVQGALLDETRRPSVRPGEARPGTGLRMLLRTRDGALIGETRSDSNGFFRFDGLASQRYEVELAEPGWIPAHKWNPLRQAVDLTAKACVQPYFSVKQEQGSIGGRITGSSESSLAGIPIQLLPALVASSHSKSGGGLPGRTTNAKGEFLIDQVEPGDYVIGINLQAPPRNGKSPAGDHPIHTPFGPTYFPGVSTRETAQVLTVTRGQAVSLPDWPLPKPLKEIEFKGVLRDPEGNPVANARVYLAGPQLSVGFWQRSQPTGADGTFSIWGFEGVDYRLSAVVRQGNTFRWVDRAKAAVEPMSIILDQASTRIPMPFSFERWLIGLGR